MIEVLLLEHDRYASTFVTLQHHDVHEESTVAKHLRPCPHMRVAQQHAMHTESQASYLHQIIACVIRLVSSGATVGLQQGSTCRSCFWLLAGAGLVVVPLVMVTALSLLHWEGGHHGQVLGERRFLEPAPNLITLSKPAEQVPASQMVLPCMSAFCPTTMQFVAVQKHSHCCCC